MYSLRECEGLAGLRERQAACRTGHRDGFKAYGFLSSWTGTGVNPGRDFWQLWDMCVLKLVQRREAFVRFAASGEW